MNKAHLSDRLKAAFEYRSPFQRAVLGKILPGWATLIYYIRLIILILNSARIAKKGGYTDEKWCRDAQLVIRFVESVGGRLQIGGIEGFARHPGPFVFISNHMSMLDTFLLPGMILPFHGVTFVVKEALLRYPVFGAIMRAVRPVAVERKNPRKDLKVVFEKGQRLLGANRSIIIFPQATRSVQFDTAAFNTLGIKLAQKAGVPVVPVALKTDFQQNGRLIKEMGPIKQEKMVHIQFGSPINVGENGQVTHRRVMTFIKQNLCEWGVPILPAIEGQGKAD
jgi:1-acyl-sn-glycerol-3-phosphate acyltransferase